MSSIHTSETLKKRWADIPFFPNSVERVSARIWPIAVLLINAPLFIVPLFMGGSFRSHLSATVDIFKDGFVLTLFGANLLASFFIAYWQSSMRETFGSVVEAGIIRNDDYCLREYSKLSSAFPRLMGCRWRYLFCLFLFSVVMFANQHPLSQTYRFLLGRHILDFAFAEDIAILSMLSLLSYAGGVVLWSLLASAIWISRFSKSSCLKLQLGHSDNCCGLGDVGLCSLQSALPLLVGMVLLVLWAYGGKLQWFAHMVNEDFLAFLQRYILGLLVLLFAVAIAQVFLPVSALHKRMLKAKREQDNDFCRLMETQLNHSKRELANGDETAIKLLNDKLKLVQSLDPVVLKLSTWPFDRLMLVTYGITPILALFSPLVNGFLNHLNSAETNRAVLLVNATGKTQYLPERSTIVAYATLTNIGKTTALDIIELNTEAHSETGEDSCFIITDQPNTSVRPLSILPGTSETFVYSVIFDSGCTNDPTMTDPISTLTISSMFVYSDKFGTKGKQNFRTVISNPRDATSASPAHNREESNKKKPLP